MNKNILTVLPLSQDDKNKLINIAPNNTYTFCSENEATEKMVKDANVIIGNIDTELISKAENLEWLQLNSAGYDQYIKQGVLKEKTILTNASGAYGVSVSEHLAAMVVSVIKKLHLYRDKQNNSEWSDLGQVYPLHGLKVLVVGTGDIGLHFAKIMKSLGNYIIGIRKNIYEIPEYVDEMYSLDKLNQVLGITDIVALCLPLSEDTKNLMGKEQFDLMKKTATFYNVGRGPLVDMNALQRALENNDILGAGIDVTDPEPLPKDHPLWKLPNIFISPHISGGYHLPETLDKIFSITLQNYKHYIDKEDMINHIKR